MPQLPARVASAAIVAARATANMATTPQTVHAPASRASIWLCTAYNSNRCRSPSGPCQWIPPELPLQPCTHTASNPGSCHRGRSSLCYCTRLCRRQVVPPHHYGFAVLHALHATKLRHHAVTIRWHAQPLANQGPGSICTPYRRQQVGSSGQPPSIECYWHRHTSRHMPAAAFA
jgi:hypothetical protein